MSIFTINNSAPDVSVVSLQREAAILNGDNAGQLKNGNMVRDVIGTIYNYALEVEPKDYNLAAYDSLYDAITAPMENYPFSAPFGQGELYFDAHVASVSDELWHMNSSINLWDKLAFTAIAREPQRYYGETWSLGSGTGNGVFTLDGVSFNASVAKLERTGRVQDNKGERSISGMIGREIVGTFYNFSMQIDQGDVREYDRLYYALTAPVDSHLLVIPYGQNMLTFQAYITRANDQLIHASEDVNIWGNLEIDFMAMAPARR